MVNKVLPQQVRRWTQSPKPEERVLKRATLKTLKRVKCLQLIGLIKLNGKLYIHTHSKYVWAPATGPLLHRLLIASAIVGAPIWRYQHMNNTNNETAGNETADDGNISAILDTVEESGMLDTIMDEPLLMALVAVVLGMGAYIAYTVPAVKELVFKYVKNNEAELMEMLDKNLSKAQMKVFEKMDETAQKHVKDSLVKNVLITAWDEKDDELAALVKSKVKAALDEQK